MGLVRPAHVSLHPPAVSPGLQVRCSSAGTGWDVSMQEGILYQGEGVVPPRPSLPRPPSNDLLLRKRLTVVAI